MRTVLIVLPLVSTKDAAHARLQGRELCGYAGSSPQDQTRFATVLSEVARNAVLHGGGGTIELAFAEGADGLWLEAVVRDQGPGLPEGQRTGEWKGLALVRRLAERFDVQS